MHVSKSKWECARYARSIEGDEATASTWLEDYVRQLKRLNPFDTFTLGSYPLPWVYDASETEFRVPLDWMVLRREDSCLLAVTRDLIGRDCFSASGFCDWARSDARRCLNREYLPKMFTPEEAALVLETPIVAGRMFSPRKAEAELDTAVCAGLERVDDKLFLLSLEEVETLFAGADAAAVMPIAAPRGGHFEVRCKGLYWWLRSRGTAGNVAVVKRTGGLDSEGAAANWDQAGLRPAMWLDPGLLLRNDGTRGLPEQQ